MSSLLWLPDGSGVISSGLDRKIIHWVSLSGCLLRIHLFNRPSAQNADGSVKEDWGLSPIRITHMALTPDGTRLVAVGIEYAAPEVPRAGQSVKMVGMNPLATLGSKGGNRMIVFDIASKQALL